MEGEGWGKSKNKNPAGETEKKIRARNKLNKKIRAETFH
jgi:hypothetical protein